MSVRVLISDTLRVLMLMGLLLASTLVFGQPAARQGGGSASPPTINPPASGAAGSSQNGLKAGGADSGTTERGDTPGFRLDGETGYPSGSFDEWLDSFRDGQRLADVRD
ncbi:MAG: hypothetical protein JXM71_03805, partial [Spirochaetales bacterium]|nr:hypothetical protein [Spirochaetales bacterium]